MRVVGYYFRSQPKEALARNNQRTGKARISEKGILGTYKRLRVPTVEEGFDELYHVHIDEKGCFIVKEMSGEP